MGGLCGVGIGRSGKNLCGLAFADVLPFSYLFFSLFVSFSFLFSFHPFSLSFSLSFFQSSSFHLFLSFVFLSIFHPFLASVYHCDVMFQISSANSCHDLCKVHVPSHKTEN